MSGFKPKRPSSARRNIKQETFSPFNSLARLRHVQSILSSDERSNKPDSILCVSGIDGRYNDGTRELVNYLLFSFFYIRKTELERSGFAEEVIDDLIFFIRAKRVDVYCNPINYHYLLPYIAHWRNIHIHCLTDEKYEDEEFSEEFKIKSFLAMVEGSERIGIPYCATGQQMDFDKMAVEKWPIIQAYALEGIGGGTFFTMKYEVSDVSADLQQLINYMDPVALEMLLTQQLPQFERQWNNMVYVCDLERSNFETMHLTEGKVCEPLSSYFSHGRVVTAKGGRSLPIRHPFVLFGTHTGRSQLEDAHKSGISFNSEPASTGICGKPAHHMICQAVSPRGPLSCTRTYFLDTAVSPVNMTGAKGHEKHTRMTDCRLLQEIYKALMTTVLQAINVYAMTLDPVKAFEFATKTLEEQCINTGIPLNPELFRNERCIKMDFSAYNNQSRRVDLQRGKYEAFVKTLGLTMYDIPSIEHSGYTLGSVSFAESFLDSSINVLYPDGSRELNSDCLVVTSNVTRFITWPFGAESRAYLGDLNEVLCLDKHEIFGQQLVQCETAHLVVNGDNPIIIQSGDISLYEEGIVFVQPHLGAVVFPKSELTALSFYDGESPSTVAILIITYREHMQDYLPPHLKSEDYSLIFAFLPRSKAYKSLFSTVLPLWRQTEPMLVMMSELPAELQSVHKQLQTEYQTSIVLPAKGSNLDQAKAKLPDLHGFLSHFVVSSVGDEPISSKHLAPVLEKSYDEGSFTDKDEMIITVLGGVPGSHKHDLCSTIMRLAKDDSRWAVLKQPINCSDRFSAENLQISLATTWNAQRRRKPGQSSKKMRAIVVTSGFTDIVDVIQAIASHPDPEVSRHIKIGSVVVCVDQNNAFIENQLLLPKLLDNCAQGWTNCVMLTGPQTSQSDSSTDKLQKLVRAANSDVALLLAPGGDLSRSADIELVLSETIFSQDSLIRARYLSCPGWWLGGYDTGEFHPDMNEVLLSFSQPLDRHGLLNKLKGIRSHHAEWPFYGNVYHVRGKVKFTESAQLYELEYVPLSGSLLLSPAELQPIPPSRTMNGHAQPAHPCCMVFTGCQLDQAILADWLRGCAKPRLQKKPLMNIKSLTKPEILKIHKQHHLDKLPEGWFYSGSQFVSLAGDRSDTHPDLQQFLLEYISEVNQEIEIYNHSVEAEVYHDLFEE